MAAAELYKQDGDYYQGVNKASCGYKLLAAMGWQEGEGLGAQKQGIKSHVKVKKKIDNAGVGKSEADARTRDWTNGMMAYEKILTSLTEITSQQQRSTASEVASDASGGGGGGRSGGGKKRTRSGTSKASEDKKASRDGDDVVNGAQPSSSSSSDDGEAPAIRKRVTHRGRFKKREASKAVSNYSCEDLTAIIGAASSFPDLTAITAQPATTHEDTSSEDDDDVKTGKDKRGKDKGGKDKGGRKKAIVQNDNTRHVEAPLTPPPEEEDQGTAWWRNYFCRSGRLGSARTNARRAKKVGFSEDDQVALYNLNKDNERCGRQGLGVRGLPPKVAGARWKGTKTKLASDSEGEDGADNSNGQDDDDDASMEDAAQSQGVVIILPKKSLPALNGGAITSQEARNTTTATTLNNTPKTPKWRKLTMRVLQEHGGVLKVKKLRKRVLAMAGGDEKKHKVAWMEVVEGSSKFVVQDGCVRLRA